MTVPAPVSVVIPTIGRETLNAVLAALARQRDPGPFEIVVVVDGGRPWDVSSAPRHPQCTRVVSDALPTQSGVSVARNTGADQATGVVLGVLDDDTLPSEEWVATARRLITGGHLAAAVGRIRETGSDPLGRLRALAYDHRHLHNTDPHRAVQVAEAFGIASGCGCRLVDYLSGGNCCVHVDAFRECGGFDPEFLVGQDRDLGLRLLARGHHVSYEPAMSIEHRTDSAVAGMLRGRFASGRSAAAMTAGTVASTRELVRSAYGAGVRDIARKAGARAGMLACLSAFAYRAGQLRWHRDHAAS
jgi:glycosyltransferase involved in cell wall biosynthesis